MKYSDNSDIVFVSIIVMMWSILLFSSVGVKRERADEIKIKPWQTEDIEYMYNYYFDPEYIKLREDIQKNSQDWVDTYR